jgi:hypothetical protein
MVLSVKTGHRRCELSVDNWTIHSPAQIEAQDRRRAAVHEAGHAVMARHFGWRGVAAEIWRIEAPTRDRSSWTGRCWLQPPNRVSMRRKRLVAVAGVVAERLWRYGGQREVLRDFSWSRPSTWWKLGVSEAATDHAATVEICLGTASINGGASSAIASVCI